MPAKIDIDGFLKEMVDKDTQLGGIMVSLREHVGTKYPGAVQEIKYGGICFFDAGLLVGGIFQSKKHVSFEFSEGGAMADPGGLLEGTGKFRRHLKLRSIEDIESKKVEYYLKQAFHE